MKLLNWAKEKVKQLSDWHGRQLHGEIKRFNKLAPIVQPPSREARKEHRWRIKFHRWASMNVGHGCPGLSGERLRKTRSQCDPKNLLVKPRYMKEVNNGDASTIRNQT
jgi:hypothetical protein